MIISIFRKIEEIISEGAGANMTHLGSFYCCDLPYSLLFYFKYNKKLLKCQ